MLTGYIETISRDHKISLSRLIASIFFAPSLLMMMPCDAEIQVHKNPQTGLLTWVADKDGFSIELIQLLPDFVRAIYAKHDFPQDELERIADYCVFGTIIKNTSNSALSYAVSDWRYGYGGRQHKVKTKTEWLEEWRKAGITFSWTLLPDSGTFEVGDWQQGFTTVDLPRESKFDLVVKWEIDGKYYTNTLEGLVCPPKGPEL